MKKCIVILMLVTGFTLYADNIEFTSQLTQDQFTNFVKEMGTVVYFNPATPAEKLGILGFDISAELVINDINDNMDFWKGMSAGGSQDDYLGVKRLRVQKGLPKGFDIGFMAFQVHDSNAKGWGIEAKYSFVDENLVMPSLSIRGTYSKLSGVEDLSLNTQSLDVLLSKDFLIVTPYASISAIKVSGDASSDLFEYQGVNETIFRKAVGLKLTVFPFLSVHGEAAFGEIDQYTLKAAIRF